MVLTKLLKPHPQHVAGLAGLQNTELICSSYLHRLGIELDSDWECLNFYEINQELTSLKNHW